MHNVLNTGNSNEFKLDDGEVLYDGFQRQGDDLPHGCLAGSCGACRIEVLEGSQNLSPMTTVEKTTVEGLKNYLNTVNGDGFCDHKDIRLSCRVRVLGPVKFKTI